MWSREMQNAVCRPATQLSNNVLTRNRVSLSFFGVGFAAICRTTMGRRGSCSQLRRWVSCSTVSSAAIMQSPIVLTQAQCRLALKHKVRTYRNDFLPFRIRTRVARFRDQRNPCGSRTIPQIRGLKKQC